MMERIHQFAALVLLSSLLFAGLVGCRGSTGDVDASGHPTRELKLTEDLTLGRLESDEVLFRYVGEVRTDADGNIYVSQSGDGTVNSFGPDGEFRFVVGGQGSAPEQVQNLQTFHVAGDSILVSDWRANLVVFDRESGAFIRRLTPEFNRERHFTPSYPGVSDHGLVATLPVMPQVTNPEATPFDRSTRRELAVLNGVSFGDALWTGSTQEWMYYTPTGPNAPLSVSTRTPQGYDSFCAVDREVAYCAENDSLVFDVIRLADGSVSRYTVPFEPLVATDADRARWTSSLRDETFRAMFNPPTRWRALEELLIDDAGRLWMQVRASRSDTTSTWWVVDPKSDYRAFVTLPDSVALLAVGAGKAYARVTAETSENWVARYAFEY